VDGRNRGLDLGRIAREPGMLAGRLGVRAVEDAIKALSPGVAPTTAARCRKTTDSAQITRASRRARQPSL